MIISSIDRYKNKCYNVKNSFREEVITYDERLAKIVPHERQFRFQQLEFYAFIHFTVNTFTDREWGGGTENPSVFNTEKPDAEQWVTAIGTTAEITAEQKKSRYGGMHCCKGKYPLQSARRKLFC